MRITTHTLDVEVSSIEELRKNTAPTPISDIQAKKYGFDPKDCEMWNGNLFVYLNNIVLVYDYFTKERKMYDFNIG
jgi:hypothetical protein